MPENANPTSSSSPVSKRKINPARPQARAGEGAADSGSPLPVPVDYQALIGLNPNKPGQGQGEGADNLAPDTNSALLNTALVLELEGIWNGILAFKGKKYSSLAKVNGLNARLMSSAERQSQVRRLSSLFNAASNPFCFYYVAKPRTLRPYIRRLDKQRLKLVGPAEKNLREQFFIVRDDLVNKERQRAVTQRDYWFGEEASGADLKTLSRAGEHGGDEDELRLGLLGTIITRFQVFALNKDPDEVRARWLPSQTQTEAKSQGQGQSSTSKGQNRKKNRQNRLHPKIPAGLTDTLGFKVQSQADQLSLNFMPAKPASDPQIIRMLAEQFNSPLSPAEAQELARAELEATTTGTRTADLSIDPITLVSRADYEEYPTYLKLGGDFISCLVVTEYPRNFKYGQLFPLVRFRDIRLSLALHARPMTVKDAETRLRTRQQVLWAVEAESKSATGNMDRVYKLESLKQLRATLASGDARLFQVSIVISVRAKSKKRMRDDLQRVAQRLTDMNFGVAYPNRNQRRAFLSSIPLGRNFLASEKLIGDRITHPNMTGENVACLLPNCISDFIQPGGIIQGRNRDDGSLVAFNRWGPNADNPHSIIIATTGAGKSVNQMWELLNEFLKDPDMEGYMIDVQNILEPFCRMVGGTVIDLSLAGGACINPLDRFIFLGRPETVGERQLFLNALFTLMQKAELSPAERNAIGDAAERLYNHFERGESAVGTVFAGFANNSFYSRLWPYLLDYRLKDSEGRESGPLQPGIMARLERIYAYLTSKYKIPSCGLVEGQNSPRTGRYSRPICHLWDNRWWYCGEGETEEPYTEPDEIKAIPDWKSKPAGVWYPHPEWWDALTGEFNYLVRAEGLFEALDDIARDRAIIDASLELKRGMPVLRDFLPYLISEGALNLAANLRPFTEEKKFGAIFNRYTNVNLDSRFISWNCKDLDEDTLRPVRMFQVINLVWARVRAYRKRRIFIADEFQDIVQNYTDTANFIRRLFQRGRYFRLSMTAIVQNMQAFLDYPAALYCCQNADRILLMKQNPMAIDQLQAKFGLTDGEVDILRSARKGEGLEKVGSSSWVHLQYEIPRQHLLAWNTNTDNRTGRDGEDEEDLAGSYTWTDDEAVPEEDDEGAAA